MAPSKKKKGGGGDALPPEEQSERDAQDEFMDDAANALAVDLLYSGLTAADVMTGDVITIRDNTTVEEVSELFQIHNINGAPVVDEEGMLIGIVTEDDIVVGGMGLSDEELDEMEEGDTAPPPANDAEDADAAAPAAEQDDAEKDVRRVAEIMTPRPIAVEEDTPIEELCNLMWNLKIHRIPIVSSGRVRGIISTIDICRLVAEGHARLTPVD